MVSGPDLMGSDPNEQMMLTFTSSIIFTSLLGEPYSARSAVFFNIVQKAFDPLRFEHHVAIFFDGFLKKRVNVCRDKIRQNNA